ncbi:hypothetical protein [Campylobacter troglodytis]|uniref:hypothetical protein n=1 Tax=Campylobacter troglodytis TaxID=654363 RepID=UPI001157F4B3|nr:hypothetical protein [Campylobacter troglodytis]TQR61010.1 hypothetical protein DMC01_03090 [Campylobacter troglodytis]
MNFCPNSYSRRKKPPPLRRGFCFATLATRWVGVGIQGDSLESADKKRFDPKEKIRESRLSFFRGQPR